MDDVKLDTPSTGNLIPVDNSIDWSLRDLVGYVNSNSGISIGVTLTVGGTLITGNLISGNSYFEQVADLLAGSPANDVTQAMVNYHAKLSTDRYDPSMFESDEDRNSVVFIHLKDAKHFFGTNVLPSNGALWRGKLSDVSGYTIGSLS